MTPPSAFVTQCPHNPLPPSQEPAWRCAPKCRTGCRSNTPIPISPSMRGHEVSFSRFGSHRRTGGELTGRAATTPNLDVLRFASSPNHDRGRPEPARPSPIRSAVSCPSATSAPRRPHTTAGKGARCSYRLSPRGRRSHPSISSVAPAHTSRPTTSVPSHIDTGAGIGPSGPP